ncbi:hypothetical protein ACF0H5_002114 [Mactra antiquata]
MGDIQNPVDCFFCNDPTLVKDLELHRNGNPNKLINRLDAVLKYCKNNFKECKWSATQVHSLINVLVKSYINTADSIKISRAVEKLWQQFEPSFSEYIHTCLEEHVIKLFLNADWTDSELIWKVSVLLEQNKQVQKIFHSHFDQVTGLLCEQFSTVIKLSPFSLTTEQSNQLYALAKICLQLFQVCTNEVKNHIWMKLCGHSETECSVKTIVENLVYILQTQGYHTDCVMLCGTAIGLMYNCCNDNSIVVRSFLNLLHHVLCSEKKFNVQSLQDTSEDTSYHNTLKTKLTECTSHNIGPVAILRGIVACGNSDILFLDCSHGNQKTVPFFYKLFEYILVLCEADLTVHYQAFLMLQIWYSRLDKISSTLESSLNGFNSTSILESSWSIVLLNWDSPVEDVPEIVVNVFTSMMSVWARIKDLHVEFPDYVLKNLLNTPWYVKGKYRILAALLKYVDLDKVYDERGELQHQLLHCLTTNHFSSSATNVYKAFLQKMQLKESAIDDWKSAWLPTLMEGLVSNDSLLRYNTSLHWIPVTFRHLPASSSVMQEHLLSAMESPMSSEHYTRLLHAWIIVVKSIRTFTGISDLDHINVRQALYHADEDVRSDAMALVCTTLKKAECISTIEVKLLKEYLPYNIKIDSAPFRQHLGSDVRKLLVRLRDSCITLLRSPASNKEKLDCAIEFVDWLHNLCISYLLPGASYQKRKGSLDLLHVLYESLIYCPDSKQRKGFVPETATKLVDFANKSGLWLFFTASSLQALITCLLDGADEIQTSSYNILTRYYTKPMLNDDNSSNGLCCHLLSAALKLCNSPKGHEGQSGAVLCKLVFNKYILESNVNVEFKLNSTTSKYDVTVTKDTSNDVSVSMETSNHSSVKFLSSMLTEIKQQLQQADTDLVKASKQYPIHGMISAFTQCLTDCDVIWQTLYTDILVVSEQFIIVCHEIIQKMLNIMSGVAGQEACPSFAEIGIALENLLLENETYTSSTSITPEYQYMLSWCWNNIKECCISVGEVTNISIRSGHPLSLSTLQDNSSTFLTVLTKCRHKGVIEGCRSAYIRFCSALFYSNQEEIFNIPSLTLDQMLTNLKYKGISSSVTRRSAGLPIVIQAVLVSEKSLKKTVLLNQALTSLFEICELPLDTDQGLTDLPQVHGLNILNALFSDASLTGSLIGHTSRAVVLVIQQFASPSWAIRNAATRYFSTLVTRIFGQKKSNDGMLCNSVSYQELLSYYPELPPFLCGILKESSTVDIKDISHIHPGLFPTLTILSCLKPMDKNSENVDRNIMEIFNIIWSFTQSPVYQLRHLVAAALVALVTKEDMMSCMTSCIYDHVTSQKSVPCKAYNSLHSNLLFIEKMIERLQSKEDITSVWTMLLQESWLLYVNNGIVSSVYVNILHKLLRKQHIPWKQSIEDLFFNVIRTDCHIVGDSVLCISIVQFLYDVYTREELCLSSLTDVLLSAENIEMRKSCLEELEAVVVKSGDIFNGSSKLISILCQHVSTETNQRIRCGILSLISRLYLISPSISDKSLQQLSDWYTNYNQQTSDCGKQIDNHSDYVLRSVLPVKAILIKAEKITKQDDLKIFCDCVNTFSQSVNENKRHTAVRCLHITGDHLLKIASHIKQTSWLTSLLDTCIRLIQDEDIDVRYDMCKFVSTIHWQHKPLQFTSFHSNICYKLFLQYLADNLTTSSDCLQFLLAQLSTPSLETLLTTRVSLQYQQLFDQEDNSFFAEKIYNIFDVHSCLKCMLKQCQDEEVMTQFRDHSKMLAVTMRNDLKFLMTVLDEIETESVINISSDNTVLGNISSFLLFCDIVTMATNDLDVRQYLLTVIKGPSILADVQRKLSTAIMEETKFGL